MHSGMMRLRATGSVGQCPWEICTTKGAPDASRSGPKDLICNSEIVPCSSIHRPAQSRARQPTEFATTARQREHAIRECALQGEASAECGNSGGMRQRSRPTGKAGTQEQLKYRRSESNFPPISPDCNPVCLLFFGVAEGPPFQCYSERFRAGVGRFFPGG